MPTEGHAKVKVRPAKSTTYWLGLGALGLGAGFVAGGVSLVIHGYATRAPVQGAEGTETDNRFTDAMIAGSALVILGVVSGIWGGSAALQNAQTKVYGDMQPAALKARSGLAQPLQQPSSAMPRGNTISILSGTF
jgi:hypothetical protein